MKILAVSDTHRDFVALKAIIEQNPDADMLIHLGDGEREFEDVQSLFPMLPMIYVGGNCDYGDHEPTHIVSACGMKIFCCHGHRYAVHIGLDLLAGVAKSNECRIALYGHTHIFRTETLNGVCVMNPGSPSSPRGGNKPTYGVIFIQPDGDIKMEIREFTGEEKP